MPAFLSGLHRRLEPGAIVVFLDNRHVEGSSTPISRVDSDGDSYQERRLKDGSTREVLKNFPEEEELEDAAAQAGGENVRLTQWRHYWCLEYRVTGRAFVF